MATKQLNRYNYENLRANRRLAPALADTAEKNIQIILILVLCFFCLKLRRQRRKMNAYVFVLDSILDLKFSIRHLNQLEFVIEHLSAYVMLAKDNEMISMNLVMSNDCQVEIEIRYDSNDWFSSMISTLLAWLLIDQKNVVDLRIFFVFTQ